VWGGWREVAMSLGWECWRKAVMPAETPARVCDSRKKEASASQTTVFPQKIPHSQKLTCAANTSHSNKVADFQPEPGDNLLIFVRTSRTEVDHQAS